MDLVERMSAVVINWDSALQRTEGDADFLLEVLLDLLSEAEASEHDMLVAIQSRDYSGVMNSGHKIKGAASSLDCHQLKDISLEIQNAGKKGMASSDESKHGGDAEEYSWSRITALFNAYRQALAALKDEVNSHFQRK